MPAQPAWFHRLDEIFNALRSMTSTHLDRAAVEKLFRVRQRRARQIMAGLEGLRVGNAAADVRERRLEDLSAGIALRPGELRVVFSGAEDLAAKLVLWELGSSEPGRVILIDDESRLSQGLAS